MIRYNILFLLLVCSHLIGDFYLQSQELAERKKKSVLSLLRHGIIYALSVFVLLVPVMSRNAFWVFVWISISHVIIDFMKLRLIGTSKRIVFLKKNAFCIDQIIHIAIMFVIAYIYANINMIALNSYGEILLKIYRDLQMKFTSTEFFRFVVIFLLIGKPTNILIKEINQKENIKKPDNTDNKIIESTERDCPEYKNAGKIIGILERILIVIMVVLKQYAALGLVFTAKSITRYDKISKDSSFAEYYLVGTLLSVLVAILAVLLIW